MPSTTVHLVRHGEVHNPRGVLYGRLPGYHLSDRGHMMAERLGAFFADGTHDVALLLASPLVRAQETAAPIARELDLETATDERLVEAANYFEGKTFGVGDGSLRQPRHWPHLINPFRPSWGEPYREQVARMHAAVTEARLSAVGREAVLVSHQLPIWEARLGFEKRRLWHDPRKRECPLASVTSFTFTDARLVGIKVSEPAADLISGSSSVAGA